jgi:hypothetical protein
MADPSMAAYRGFLKKKSPSGRPATAGALGAPGKARPRAGGKLGKARRRHGPRLPRMHPAVKRCLSRHATNSWLPPRPPAASGSTGPRDPLAVRGGIDFPPLGGRRDARFPFGGRQAADRMDLQRQSAVCPAGASRFPTAASPPSPQETPPNSGWLKKRQGGIPRQACSLLRARPGQLY